MAKEPLATKYRPTDFSSLTEQSAIKDILENQIKTKTFQHGYLFTGPSGTGKTTSARIFASMINDGKGNPIEVDAASNSGVDNIRQIIEDAKRKPLDAEYKIFIVDECHSLSDSSWQALLKTLEEPPKFTIFIFCTTNPEKIPPTILSRVQRYNFQKISNEGVYNRLNTILEKESDEIDNLSCKLNWEQDALEFIVKVSSGGMRDAITLLDKCLSLSHDVTLENVLKTIGSEDYDTFFAFLEELCNREKNCITIIEHVYISGKDVKQFMKEFSKFILDVEKYILYGTEEYMDIPATSDNLEKLNCFKDKLRSEVFDVMELVVSLNEILKWEQDPKTLIELSLLLYCEGK